MAAPPEKTLADLNGKWVLNKELSSDTNPGLALQGIGWLTRKAVGLATVTLNIKQYNAPASEPSTASDDFVHIDVEQTATGGLKGTTEHRTLDFEFRPHSDWMFGSNKGRSKWATPADIEDPFLKKGEVEWIEDDSEKSGPNGETHVYNEVVNLDASGGWTAKQAWGFQIIGGKRHYVRNIVIAKGSERVELRLVYDYLGLS